ncbi:hypothetical protein POJ06DRAFT_245655 [Lipomyces tetrasporus]|uniref:Uncharacterized protein n=1 Tax=Lipomyces tetrasporus TaxID=54092 RepID=A0AAD7QWV0_9ASCO|nr:uncharacterized protein POJ06DRAFT_245655 [Lipomyces tetrasporus]KAJ8102798.1 hypothetical protein POJ06DRAFT_245655 [Lipomyces tetrasporus]
MTALLTTSPSRATKTDWTRAYVCLHRRGTDQNMPFCCERMDVTQHRRSTIIGFRFMYIWIRSAFPFGSWSFFCTNAFVIQGPCPLASRLFFGFATFVVHINNRKRPFQPEERVPQTHFTRSQ